MSFLLVMMSLRKETHHHQRPARSFIPSLRKNEHPIISEARNWKKRYKISFRAGTRGGARIEQAKKSMH